MLMVALFLLLAYYGFTALVSRDPVWFSGDFQGQPSRIVIYKAGERTELRPGDLNFQPLADAVVSSLDAGFARLTSLGLSEPSLQAAYSEWLTLEVFFERPVEIHTWFSTGRTTQMLFLLSGRYAEMEVVFLGDEGKYRSGAPQLERFDLVREAVDNLEQ
jgi:hypothetical protein